VHDNKLLQEYGSRGEQRLGILWLKIAELAYIENQLKTAPLLLLDDILSELDEAHRALVLSLVNNQQTIITTTDQTLVDTLKKPVIITL
jgi:DNA replication and repair protein RecF